MNFNKHSELEGLHSFLSASQGSWVNYTEEKALERYHTAKARERGTRLHALAEELIFLKQKLPRTNQTLNMYVNDAIGFGMSTEVILYYSTFAFATVDAILFKNNLLRIHDLKTGVIPANERQLLIYAAYFCLEYGIDPNTIKYDLRIYQNDEIIYIDVQVSDIEQIMSQIILIDKALTKSELEG